MRHTIPLLLALGFSFNIAAQQPVQPPDSTAKADLLCIGIVTGSAANTGTHLDHRMTSRNDQVWSMGYETGISGTYETRYSPRTDFAADFSLTYNRHHLFWHHVNYDGSVMDSRFIHQYITARLAPKVVIHTRGPLSFTAGMGFSVSTDNLRHVGGKDLLDFYESIVNYHTVDLNVGISLPLTPHLTADAQLMYDFFTYGIIGDEEPLLFPSLNCRLLFSLRYIFSQLPVP